MGAAPSQIVTYTTNIDTSISLGVLSTNSLKMFVATSQA
jgi:hypothetical protein